jgi:hypothetical protein
VKRRDFLTASLAASLVTSSPNLIANPSHMNKDEKLKPEYYELRLYHLRRGPKVKLVDEFFRDVALPALKRLEVGPVGFFNVMIGPDNPTLYVLLPHKSLESFATLNDHLATDNEYQKASASYFNLQAENAAYVRMGSSLMIAFDTIPRLEVPENAKGNKPRIFELRTYESHNERAAKKKIEMFNIKEIELFRRTGLKPVFFGETLIGPKMPNLTYMLTYDDMQTRDKNWSTFISDPEWKKLSTTPGFTDAEIVTNISSVFLRPTSYSQI